MSAHPVPDRVDQVLQYLDSALKRRGDLFDAHHESAFRLFSGFYEGFPDLVVDLYARTLIIYDYSDDPSIHNPALKEFYSFYLTQLPWLHAVILKAHKSSDPALLRGVLVQGDSPDRYIIENQVWYAIDLQINQDASFYLDTRNLRIWAKSNLEGKSVLNTFAYTGSLGVAARAGNSGRVVYLDKYGKYLDIAKKSYTLNGFPVKKSDFIAGDFWRVTGWMRGQGELYDCVFVDPPVYAQSSTGVIDMVFESSRVINKVRPLVGHDGYLVVVNNALFLSGKDFLNSLVELCANGYMQVETILPVPNDIAIPAQSRIQAAHVDPEPFNHSTKIAILRVWRKDKRHAGILNTSHPE